MGEVSKISWTDATFNPWIGCQKIAPACDGCYAARLMDERLHRVTFGGPGKGIGTRSLTSDANWLEPDKWDRKARKAGTRPFVFCASLADVFDKHVNRLWRRRLFAKIEATPRLVYLLLTKRPQFIIDMVKDAGGMPDNVALGTTCEDQEHYDRGSLSLEIAKGALNPLFTFISMEPLLGQIVMRADDPHEWVITGGETDQGEHMARPTNPQWLRDLRDQSTAMGKVFHHKQNGEWVSASEVEGDGEHFTFPDGRTVRKLGKARTGRTIDGVEHDARPVVEPLP